MKKSLAVLAVLGGVLVLGGVCYVLGMQSGNSSIVTVERIRAEKNFADGGTVSFVGYVRGRGQTTLKNKYAGFVSKVHFYSHSRVKKGDVILEYDDLALRTAVEKLEHSIAEQRKTVESRKLKLALARLDPLSSEYRNLHWKRKIAQENLERSSHEFKVYERLHTSKIVTDLDYLEKKEAFRNSEAEVRKMDSDMKILSDGLADLYVRSAETELAGAELRLRDLQEELVRLNEERKYYRIVAPYDGLCITNSDTVHGYDAAGAAAAEVHRDDRKLVYAYCPEHHIRHVREGMTVRFVSNQYPDDRQGTQLRCFEIKKSRSMYGDESYFLVKFRVVAEPYPLQIGSIGMVEIVPDAPKPDAAD